MSLFDRERGQIHCTQYEWYISFSLCVRIEQCAHRNVIHTQLFIGKAHPINVLACKEVFGIYTHTEGKGG